MDSKPIVTCHGDQVLFSKLRNIIVQGLPKEPVEWKRAYGRPRTVNIEANFVPFNPDILPEEDDWSLPGRPFFHTYWLDCDLDRYKSEVKEEIADWLMNLKEDNINDWLIIVVVNDENKVKTKILRTSVYDKVKSDFCGKNSDRCIVLTEPLKSDTKSLDSWAAVLARMRLLLLQSYDTNLGRFEDHMRAERERRTEKGWNFCSYFLLQEELALMFEMLNLYEDALVQYDELDALFTQYVLNHAAGDTAPWLSTFTAAQNQTWDGLCLSQPINVTKRQLIKKNKASLLDFRNYLFSRQCALTFLLQRPWEVAQRSIPFMHNCIHELKLLDIEMPAGATSCWVYISCLEVLQQCEKYPSFNEAGDQYLYTASLWDYARIKLGEVAEICGFLQDDRTASFDSKHISFLVEGATVNTQKWCTDKEEDTDPINKLKEVMSSKEAFQKYYLELSELAMGTYKIIGRTRCARQIGRDLAIYYMKLGEWQKAEGFLQDALKVYKQEGWDMLADQMQLDIARCNRKLNNKQKLIKSCLRLACSEFLPQKIKTDAQNEVISLAEELKDDPVLVSIQPVFWIEDIVPASDSFIQHHRCELTLILKSTLPKPIHSETVRISATLKSSSTDSCPVTIADAKKRSSRRRRHSSTTSVSGIEFYDHIQQSLEAQNQLLDLRLQMETKPDSRIITVSGISHHGQLHRIDSNPLGHKEQQLIKEDFKFMFEARDVDLHPGDNVLTLTGQFSEKGCFKLDQLSLTVAGVEFLKHLRTENVSFRVMCDEPQIKLIPKTEPVLAGLPQQFTLNFKTGSYEVEDGFELFLKLPDTLTFKGPDVVDTTITMPKCQPNKQLNFDLEAYAELPVEADPEEKIRYELQISCPMLSKHFEVELVFLHPFRILHKLHTAGTRKFVQVLIQGMTAKKLTLQQHSLTTDSTDFHFLPLNKPEECLTVSLDLCASYVWQLNNDIPECPRLPCLFTVHYTAEDDPESRLLQMNFELKDYLTLVTVKSMICPSDGSSGMCEAGHTCILHISIHASPNYKPTPNCKLMYEVISEADIWAITGTTTGVFDLNDRCYEYQLDVIPLVGGRLPVPQINIVRYQASIPGKASTEEETDADDECSVIMPFSPGQVYNTSLAQHVYVIPAANKNHIDISAVM